jgi:hypothetical protein
MPKAANKVTPIQSLIDERIREYSIPQWPYEPSFDRIIVYSVPEDAASRETFSKGGILVKPETRKSRDEAETPRGILCAAGLGAHDYLRSHGYSLGHMVWVARLSPWRHEVDKIEGKTIEFLFLRAGDLVGSEDLLQHIRDGRVKVAVGDDGVHRYEFIDESIRPRFDPPSYVA